MCFRVHSSSCSAPLTITGIFADHWFHIHVWRIDWLWGLLWTTCPASIPSVSGLILWPSSSVCALLRWNQLEKDSNSNINNKHRSLYAIKAVVWKINKSNRTQSSTPFIHAAPSSLLLPEACLLSFSFIQISRPAHAATVWLEGMIAY